MNRPGDIFSIGHSSLSYEQFVALLKRTGIDAVADVRSAPWSRRLPHFNRDVLRAELRQDSIAYSFLGGELGGRPADRRFYCDGVADYDRMAATELFAQGLDRLIAGAKSFRIALMCSEKHPLDCHRCLLVGRALLRRGVDVQHVVETGDALRQSALETGLLEEAGHEGGDLFATAQEQLAIAYRRRAKKVAYAEPGPAPVAAAQ